ncbi:Tn3 family transposase [Variovorax sp. PAMC26660]|uniref:Tn3 family transposase n=1 Tax=Variovorax sp. PAMC26660 TaxID=2762322 RepID=UPI00164D6A2B|nr:Tn3 family transposase [Variovorax sp. PAMC26660]QNK67157.1 Tn3 family transposase [Variovorax sp. PAMC26660]
MSTYAYRFVGRESLPSRLTEFDLEQFFQLTVEDVEAIRERFRVPHRGAAALQLLFLRASGRPLDRFAALPRNLLAYVSQKLATPALSIASLRSLYQRRPTLYEHQLWTRNHLGLSDLGGAAEAEVTALLHLQAAEASHADDLVTAANHWLYDHRILIPGERRVRDWARDAFATVEAGILKTITAAVPTPALKRCRDSAYSLRPDGIATHLEWLKTPPKRDGPSTFAETLDKIRYLKSLAVHEWALEKLALAKQRAYAQQVQGRRPAKTRELKESRQTIELVCFLHVSLLEFTDVVMHQSSRRSQKLFRDAAQKALAIRGKPDTVARQQATIAREVLRDTTKTWQARGLEADRLLSELLDVPHKSFSSQVRQALSADHQRVAAFLGGMEGLAFGGQSNDAGFQQWTAWRELRDTKASELPADFSLPDVGPAWRELVRDADPKRGLQAFAACTMMSMRKSLRSGAAWIDHSLSFRSRDQMLISPEEWARNRDRYIALLGAPAKVDDLLERLQDNLRAGVAAVAEACEKGKVEIGADGMLHLPPVSALPDDGEPRRMRELIYKWIGDVQFPDLLLEIDALCNFSEALLGHRAQTVAELLALYAALLAHGTDIDAKSVAAMIPGLDMPKVSVAMRALETHGRLRRANERVVEFQGRIPMAAHWGSGEKASSDMMALDASRHLWNARVDPRRRTFAVGIYTHILDRWGISYDQPIVHNERQAGVAVNGVEQHNRSQDRIRLSLLAVDTHGYTNPAMAVAKLLGFDLCPRLRDLSERKLHLPTGFEAPEGIERVTVKRVSLKAIRAGWDELLRVIASVRIGKIDANLALRYLGSAAKGDPAYKAADHLGRLLRSIFLCDYITIEDFRREIHTLLSRGESVHLLQRAVYTGKLPTERGRRGDEMKAISGSHALLTNIVLAWNTHRMNDVVERLRKDAMAIDDAWLRRIGPVHFGHINFRGTFKFAIERYAQALLQRAPEVAPSRRAA